MKRILTVLMCALAIGAMFAPTASASHFRGGDLSWVLTGAANEVELKFTGIFRRGYGGSGGDGLVVTGDIFSEGIGGTGLAFGDGGSTGQLRFVVTSFSIADNWVIAEALQPGFNDVNIRHTYAGAGPYTATLTGCCRIGGLNNRSGGYRIAATGITPQGSNSSPVTNQSPIVFVGESNAATFPTIAGDPDGDPLLFRFATNAESGATGSNPPNMSIDPSTGVVTWNTLGLNQTNFWTTQIIVDDGLSEVGVDFFLKIVPCPPGNTTPSATISIGGSTSVGVGQPLSFVVTASDPDAGDSVLLNVSGLPVGATMTPGLPDGGASPFVSTFDWTPGAGDVGLHAIAFQVTDDCGIGNTVGITIDVLQDVIAPEFPVLPAPDEAVKAVSTATNPNTMTVTATICDAESIITGATLTSSAGGGPMAMSAVDGAFDSLCEEVTITVSLDGIDPGLYDVCVTATDAAGNVSAPQCFLCVIYDPSAGFVTGGGWIDSPAGAYVPDASLTGTANFGFVSKYKKGKSTPDGSTEFQFQTAGLNYHSNEYEWLIVTGSGKKAMFKGTGTLNGVPGYMFQITAHDDDPVDKFRMRITDGGGVVVYDNQLGAADDADASTNITKGSIQIHTGGKK